jgi:hypothetical protein
VRDQRLPGDCHGDPGDHATATPPGPADSATRTATAGLPPVTGERARARSPGRRRRRCGRFGGGILGAATAKTRFLSSGAIIQRECSAISGSATMLSRLSPRKSTPVLLESNVFPSRFPVFRHSPPRTYLLSALAPFRRRRPAFPHPSAPPRRPPRTPALTLPYALTGPGRHRAADRRPRFNIRHACPARHG